MPTKSGLLLVYVFILSYQVERVSSEAVTDLGDSPTATLEENRHLQELYSYLYKGSVPVFPGQTGRLRKTLGRSAGRLDSRQTTTCDPGFVFACPSNEAEPCCPADHPICCVNNGICCETGTICAGTVASPYCCPAGSIICADDGCCPAGNECCGDVCCTPGHVCAQGGCVNPIGSSISEQSVAASASSESIVSVQSVVSVSSFQASIWSALVTQAGYSNDDTVMTRNVNPGDDRIKYDPLSVWYDAEGGGSCPKGTKFTQTAGAKFTFIFRGTSVSIFLALSSPGGTFTVAVDGKRPVDHNFVASDHSSSDPCNRGTYILIDGLEETPHQLLFTNGDGSPGSNGGKLGITGIAYTGRGAFGTPNDKSSRPSPAVIGGSVGGVIGALVIGGIVFCVYRKKRNNAANNGTRNEGAINGGANDGGAGPGGARGAAVDNQMMQQADAQAVVSPYAGSGGFPSPSGSGQEPLLSPGQHQQFGYSQQQRHPVYQDWQGGVTNSAPIAPLPNGA
ncbi:hypothetical protein FRC19_010435 [Serendipita sp. 401]|nr:hypothetical protein FRC19_010435 [Serendipita sp. 401]